MDPCHVALSNKQLYTLSVDINTAAAVAAPRQVLQHYMSASQWDVIHGLTYSFHNLTRQNADGNPNPTEICQDNSNATKHICQSNSDINSDWPAIYENCD